MRAGSSAWAWCSRRAAKDWKTVSALTGKGLLTSTAIPEGRSSVYITEAGYAALGREPPAASEAPLTAPAPEVPKGKIATLVAMLRAAEGATVDAMMTATGWQAHSVRGAMSGSVKKALGLSVVSEKIDGVRVYRIIEATDA